MTGTLYVVGFGPGHEDHITDRAKQALKESDYVIGYKTYMELVAPLIDGKEVISTGMSEEVSRAQAAVKQAERGKTVSVISSGDAGVYGMAGLVYEVLAEQGWDRKTGITVEIIPGISAINSCASLLGAPIMHDACTISLSDHLTPWELIEKRIDAAGAADFVIALYNPKSGRRTKQIEEAQRILLKYRKPETPVGLVKSAYRDREEVVMTTLEEMLEHDIGMLTTVIIGNSTTFFYDGLMITPRGYTRKYTLTEEKQPLRPHERLRPENEPWALHGGEEEKKQPLKELGLQALAAMQKQKNAPPEVKAIFEAAVSPGVVNKHFTPQQLIALSEAAGEKGTIEYTPHHYVMLKTETADPAPIIDKLHEVGLELAPVGDVVTVKACDFCNGDKSDAIPQAEKLQRDLGGLSVPKELRIGVNGCGMACYGAVNEDIGIVYRKGAFDLFLGAKVVSRTAHPGVYVAEGIPPEKIVPMLTQIVEEYRESGHPNERFFKYFKRVGEVEGFIHRDMPVPDVEPMPCGE
ncbi:precorrin-3B C(17)-methyltransferase [Domibacillus sp. A3M-37]|uniref:precorrin-3B C(17)-methyltransferase n=1 Tax=Domibacillus sp. A3M-37 TaxID=2962037 RepID=UPI0020B6EA3E|nr:precorrin-3B C(17)-methyltransferase [Domibacillus sp. A3M-37]MCP3761775.1 precorrin-3B C(17)-methyltransferase [Domibacillus sp. A3M-37]